MVKKMETTMTGFIGIMGYILGLSRGNGKENGNYYLGFSVGGYIRIRARGEVGATKVY